MVGTLYWGLYCVRALRLQQVQPDAVPLSLFTLLSPSGMESRRWEGGREEDPSGADVRDSSGSDIRAPSGADGSATSGSNVIAPSGSPYE